ncbi:MAG: hypothetical protein M1368_10045 [Thaumarchaeota archaeon]|nr:hypothetical protein [Nitrososphaerota archaeon]
MELINMVSRSSERVRQFVPVIIFAVFICSLAISAPRDSAAVKTVHQHIGYMSGDTLNVKVVGSQDPGFWERTTGYLLPTVLSIIVAWITVLITMRAEKERSEEAERDKLRRLLEALKEEVVYHQKMFNLLQQELASIQNSAVSTGQLVYNKPKRSVALGFLRGVQAKILELPALSHDLLKLLGSYVNGCELVNTDLDFDELRTMINQPNLQVPPNQVFTQYFSEMIGHVKDLETVAAGLIKLTDHELQQLKK